MVRRAGCWISSSVNARACSAAVRQTYEHVVAATLAQATTTLFGYGQHDMPAAYAFCAAQRRRRQQACNSRHSGRRGVITFPCVSPRQRARFILYVRYLLQQTAAGYRRHLRGGCVYVVGPMARQLCRVAAYTL